MQSDQARLEALRDRLEAILGDPGTSPRDMAVVSREYRQTVAALAALAPTSAESTRLDEIAARRRKRGAS
jgi:hypothetical protein